MNVPDGYRLVKMITETPRKLVAKAVCEREQTEVVLKAYPDPTGDMSADRVERELAILRSLAPGLAPRGIAVEPTEDYPVLVIECLDGAAPRGPLPTDAFLRLAIATSRALVGVHTARVVHRALASSHIWVDPARAGVRLIGFGGAAPLGAPADPVDASRLSLLGPLCYMPPEQTGRIERGVDFRSDLYALGATFYELLTGRPPFDAADPLALVQAHIARRAKAPSEIHQGVPGTLSRITMKLLEKEPEDRYQTAEALCIDLETCMEQWERSGGIDDDLILAATDAPYRPLFRHRIYGRASEVSTLKRAYARAKEGQPALVLVHGPPGIGKSALVPELYRPLALDGGYLARGKLDLYRGHLPYAGVVTALRALLHQVVGEDEAQRAIWRRALERELGRLASALAELLPELGRLLGDIPPAPPLGPAETLQRLTLAVRRLIVTASHCADPLVLFLDDLQWADAGTRHLLEDLLTAADDVPLLLLGAYRDNEVDANHPLRALIERLTAGNVSIDSVALRPLSDEAVCEMLGDALANPPENVRELAGRVTRHSGNNPLLIQQCVYHLHNLECIRFEPGRGWTWDLLAAEQAVIPEDPAGMMLVRLQRLGTETRNVVQLASCVGDEFNVALLAELSGADRATLDAALYDLSDAGLIAPCRSGMRFVHDRVREAAQALLPEAQRAKLHYRTASLLIERLDDEEQRARCLEIADHLSRAMGHIPEERRIDAATRQRVAGSTALGRGAGATAVHYFEAGVAMLRDQDWSDHRELCFELHLDASLAAGLAGRFDRAAALLDAVEQQTLDPTERARTIVQRVTIASASRPFAESLELIRAALRDAGAPLPSDPSWLRVRLEIARVDWLLRGPADAWRFQPAEMHDPTKQLPRLVRTAGASVLSASSVQLGCIATAHTVREVLRDGYDHAAPGYLLAGFATLRRGCLRDARGLARYIEASRRWMDRTPNAQMEARMEYFSLVSRSWLEPRRPLIPELRSLVETLHELGDLQWAIAVQRQLVNCLVLFGEPLDELQAARARTPDYPGIPPFDQPAHRLDLALELQRPSFRTDAADPAVRLERYTRSAEYITTIGMLISTVRCDFLAVWEGAEAVRAIIFRHNASTTHVADYLFLRGLAAANLCGSEAGLMRRARLSAVGRACERELRRYARHGPDFEHMADLIAAERLTVKKRVARASLLFERARDRALGQGYLHHAAIACERHAAALRSSGAESEASAALARARELYGAWGALAKVDSLDARPPSPDGPAPRAG